MKSKNWTFLRISYNLLMFTTAVRKSLIQICKVTAVYMSALFSITQICKNHFSVMSGINIDVCVYVFWNCVYASCINLLLLFRYICCLFAAHLQCISVTLVPVCQNQGQWCTATFSTEPPGSAFLIQLHNCIVVYCTLTLSVSCLTSYIHPLLCPIYISNMNPFSSISRLIREHVHMPTMSILEEGAQGAVHRNIPFNSLVEGVQLDKAYNSLCAPK